MGLEQILERYRQDAGSKRELGDRFEELMKRYLLTDPQYSDVVEWVSLWNDFFARREFGVQDTGIDLVAKTVDGEYWAIQCKCYAEGHQVTKSDVDTFLSISGKRFHEPDGTERQFSSRVIFTTTNSWSSHAIDSQEGQIIPVTLIGLKDLNEARVDWDLIDEGIEGTEARLKKHELRPHQTEALNAAVEYYKENDRGKMIMACGTGKTFTSLRIAESLVPAKGCVLFLAPSISLVGQTLREWTSNTVREMKPICVCSDTYVSKKKRDDDVGETVDNLAMPATTDPNKISRYRDAGKLTVVFSTYQSIDAVMDAQKLGFPEFDLIICDEAHRTTGVTLADSDESAFVKVHSNSNIFGRKRLYMTATPRIYGVKGKEKAKDASAVICSMDDEALYGKEFYHISFGQAVEKELLTDYKVMILSLRGSDMPDSVTRRWSKTEKEIDADMDTLIWGCLNALAKNMAYDKTLKNTDPGNMKSAVLFARTIKRSKDIAERFNELAALPDAPVRAEVKHIDGSMNAMERDDLMTWLKQGDEDDCHALSNVRCLCEGVDVPALDAVMFMDSKGSLVDVVQSVGRVMRRAPGKKYGYIVIPILIPGDEDAESALDDNDRYKVVWQVLRALRSHDERLDAEINTFLLRKSNIGGHIHAAKIIPVDRSRPKDSDSDELEQLYKGQYCLDDFTGKLFARLVLKVGDREYIENWAKDVAKVMPDLMERLKQICTGDYYDDDIFDKRFKQYHSALMMCVNENVTEEQAISMLAQQIVTKPIFERLFGEEGFVLDNSVSRTIDGMLKEIDAKKGLEDIDDRLKEFYAGVERTLSRIDTVDGKQKVITALYEKFFKNAFPKDQAINGVVYTPIEIVDFIIHSAVEVLKQEFGRDINDEGVNVLDPFTGTGTFIARLMESGLITKENLERKYRKELFANEITLLAYYIAAVNIENTFSRITGSESYVPFENILLTDTFNIEEICRRYGSASQDNFIENSYFRKNRAVIRKENDTPITLIIGNPPYGARQKSNDDETKKRKYRQGIDARIESTYLDESKFDSKIGNVNSVYDNYIRAFRWATDRLRGEDGIIAFITPNGWMTGSAFEGFRKTIESEFSAIYVLNLRGDQNGADWKEQGEKVFGQGSKVGIAITLLVKRGASPDKAVIHYYAVEDYLKRQEKFEVLTSGVSFPRLDSSGKMDILHPKDNGDWIVQRSTVFPTLIPLACDKARKFDKHCEKSIFTGYSLGYTTNRDAWSYNFSQSSENQNMNILLTEYNRQTSCKLIEYESSKIKWARSLEESSRRGKYIEFDEEKTKVSFYRPFSKQYFYTDPNTMDQPRQMPRIYPDGAENLTICVASIGDKKDFSCLMTNTHTDLHFTGTSQCFPLYWYETDPERSSQQRSLTDFGGKVQSNGLVRHDGISDWALQQARSKYVDVVTKEDIFYYIYGYLHSTDYRAAFRDDLKLSLPRIGLVDDPEDFRRFVDAGRKLADLHLNYESAPPCREVLINGRSDIETFLNDGTILKVTKMKLDPLNRKLVYNEFITIENIPEDAFRYIVNGRSALGWIVDQYQISKDKESGIVNDPNEYAGSAYILNLILSVITVSVETVRIQESLPRLVFIGGEEL